MENMTIETKVDEAKVTGEITHLEKSSLAVVITNPFSGVTGWAPSRPYYWGQKYKFTDERDVK